MHYTIGVNGSYVDLSKLTVVDLSKLKGTPYALLKFDATGKKADTSMLTILMWWMLCHIMSYLRSPSPDSITAGANILLFRFHLGLPPFNTNS